MEEWKEIENYPNYMVSNKGNVKSLNYKQTGLEKIMKQKKRKNGYCEISLRNKDGGRWFLVHRLVAMAFIPNPENKPQVNHKDENKENNSVENLEWMTSQENLNYGEHNKKMAKTLGIPVVAINIDTGLRLEFESATEASRVMNLSQGNIWACCKNKYGKKKNVYKNFIWSYI